MLHASVAPNDPDLRSQVLQLQQIKPDAISLRLGPSQMVARLKRLEEHRIKAKIYSFFIMSSPDVVRAAGESAEGVLFADGY